MKNMIHQNIKINNTLNDMNKLLDKNIDFIPLEIPLLIRSSNNSALNLEYRKHAEHKNNLNNFHKKVLFYNKIKLFNNKKYNDYYYSLMFIITKNIKLNNDVVSYIMEYLYFDENTFDYQEFVNIYMNNYAINAGRDLLKIGLLFMNIYGEFFTNDELSELYYKFHSLQKEYMSCNNLCKNISITNKLFNIVNMRNKNFSIDFTIQEFLHIYS